MIKKLLPVKGRGAKQDRGNPKAPVETAPKTAGTAWCEKCARQRYHVDQQCLVCGGAA